MRDVPSRLRAVEAMAALGAAVLLAVAVPSVVVQDPGQDEGDQSTTSEETTTTEAPTTTTTEETTTSEAPATSGAVTTGEAPSPASTAPDVEPAADTGDDDDIDWSLVAIVAALVVAALAIVAVVVGLVRRKSQEARVFSRRLAEVVGRAEWLHDEGSLEVLGARTAPERLQVVWADTRRRLDDTGAHASSLAAHTSDAQVGGELRHLSHSLGRLGSALDTHVGLHSQMSGDPSVRTALEGASETVMQRREDLAAALRPLAARV